MITLPRTKHSQSHKWDAAGKIRNYRDAYAVNRQVAFLPACMTVTTSGRIHREFLRLLFFLSNKQADDYFALLPLRLLCDAKLVATRLTRRSFAITAASSSTATGAPSAWRVLTSVAWRPHHSTHRSSPRLRPSPPAAPTPRRR